MCLWLCFTAAMSLLAARVVLAADEPARRIVSLAPHLTELVFEAGAGDRLVGAVEYSDYPPAARSVPRVGDSFRIDRERVASLAPDLILAWAGGTPPAVIERLEDDGYRVVILATERPEAVADTLVAIGRLAGREEETQRKAATYRAEMNELRRRYAQRPPVRVFVQVAVRPLYTVNDRQMIGQVVRLCGGRNVFGELGELAPVVSAEAVVAADPEVILSTARHVEGADPFETWRRFPGLSAVRGEHLYRLEPDRVVRAGLRLAAGTAEVCRRIDGARETAGDLED